MFTPLIVVRGGQALLSGFPIRELFAPDRWFEDPKWASNWLDTKELPEASNMDLTAWDVS